MGREDAESSVTIWTMQTCGHEDNVWTWGHLNIETWMARFLLDISREYIRLTNIRIKNVHPQPFMLLFLYYIHMYIFQEWHWEVEALHHLATLTESSPYNVLEFTTLRGEHTYARAQTIIHYSAWSLVVVVFLVHITSLEGRRKASKTICRMSVALKSLEKTTFHDLSHPK